MQDDSAALRAAIETLWVEDGVDYRELTKIVLAGLLNRLDRLEQTTPDDSSGFHRAAHERTVWRIERLEAQSQALPPTTVSPTTAAPSVAPVDRTPAPTPQSPHPLGDLTEADLTHVAQCLTCWGRLDRWWSWSRMHVQGVSGLNSISVKPESPSSAAPEPDAAPSASSACSCPDWWTVRMAGDREQRGWHHHESCPLSEKLS